MHRPRRPKLTLLLILGLVCPALAPGGIASAQEGSASLRPVDDSATLPGDPGLVSGRLDNGLSYRVLGHATPPDRAYAVLRVDVGSLDELDNERSMARFAQSLSMVWARGEALERLGAHGLSVVEDLTGRAQYDQTSFALALPGSDGGTLASGFEVLASMARGGLIDGPMVERARRTIGASLRAEGDGAARARAQWLEDLGGISLFGKRPPEGDLASIAGVSPEGLAVFRRRWYRAANMTLIVVGDVDARETVALIEHAFAGLEGGEIPERQSRGIGAPKGRRAVVGSDPELGRAQVALLRIAPPRDPVRTVAGLRRFMLEQTAMLAMEVRLRSAMSEGRLSVEGLRVYSADLFRSMQYSQIAVAADGASWRTVLAQLGSEVARVREHAFTPGEVEEARYRFLARLGDVVEGRPSQPSSELIRWLAYSDAQGHTWVDPATELALARRILLEADAQRLADVFRALAPAGEEVVLVSAPGGDTAPMRAEALRISSDALDAQTLPIAEAPESGRLFERLPEAGRIVEISAHPPSGVWSALLDNAVRVHHTRVGSGGDRMILHITLGAGSRETPPGEVGLRKASAHAWSEPALRGMSSTTVRRIMAQSRLEVRSWVSDERVHIQIETTPEHLTTAMELGRRMLTDPVIEAPSFERWKRREIASLHEQQRDPLAMGEMALDEAVRSGGDGPVCALSPERVEAITLDEARAWMGGLIESASIEAAVVGDVSRSEAFELCERYLGSLSERADRPAPTEKAALCAPVSDIVRQIEVQTVTPASGVIVGMLACDAGQVRDAHLLSLAARILEQRLTRELRDVRGLVTSAPTRLEPGPAGSGRGTLLVRVSPEPEHAREVADLIEREIAKMVDQGVSEAELLSVMRRVERAYLEAVATPSFWGERLGDLTQAGRSLDDIVGVLDRQESFTPEDVRAALEAYYGTRPRVRIIALPTKRE